MKKWLHEKRRGLLLVAVVVPVIGVIVFWSVIRPEWPLWLACYVVGLPAGVVAVWGRQQVVDRWSGLERRQRVLLRCIAAVSLWSLAVLAGSGPDRVFTATVETGFLLLLWASYALFSRLMDRIWSRIRRR
jgi:hypothetical protein